MSDENKSALKAHQDRTRDRLREGLARVARLEDETSQEGLEKWIAGETRRYGGRRVELDDAPE